MGRGFMPYAWEVSVIRDLAFSGGTAAKVE